MLTLPFRLAATIFITLFLSSSLVRRAVAGIAVSAAIVAMQHEPAFTAFATVAQGETGIGPAFSAVVQLILGLRLFRTGSGDLPSCGTDTAADRRSLGHRIIHTIFLRQA